MRRALFVLGLLALAGIWLGPLPQLARYQFWSHMTMHMGIVAVAAPLISIGIAGGPFDLAQRFPRIFSPIPASIVELIIVWAWHAPGLHHAARNDPLGLVCEQGMFFACGMWVWLSAFGGDARHGGYRTAAGVLGLLLTSMHMTLLGALLGLAPRTLYRHPLPAGGDWLAALPDQQLGGAIMLLVGGLAYLIGGLWLTVILLRPDRGEAQ